MTYPHLSYSPSLMAHRGYASCYPENTLESILAAAKGGVPIIEFDVQLTRDRVPVLLHDASLLRTAGVDVNVTQTDFSELQKLYVNETARLGDVFHTAKIPSLQDAVDLLVTSAGWTYFVEIKRESIEAFGIDAVADAVLPVLEPAFQQCVIISFDFDCVLHMRRHSGSRVGWVLRQWDETAHRQAQELQPDFLLINYLRLPPTGALWQGNWQWACYEITDARHALQLQERGVDIISSMAAVDLLQDLKALRGSPHA